MQGVHVHELGHMCKGKLEGGLDVVTIYGLKVSLWFEGKEF